MKKIKYKVYLIVSIIILFIVSLFQIYIFYFEERINDWNARNILKIKSLSGTKRKINIAIIGEISNNIYIWEDFVNKIKIEDIDFVISLGDFIFESSEFNYRLFFKMLKKLKVPFLAIPGKNEINDKREYKFIKYFGIEYFYFKLNNSIFIFLNTSANKLSISQKLFIEQIKNLIKESKFRFIFTSKPFLKPEIKFFKHLSSVFTNKSDINYLLNLCSTYKINIYFSAGLPLFYAREIGDTTFIITGGGGGTLIPYEKRSFFHFVKLSITNEGYNYHIVDLMPRKPNFFKKLFLSIWFKISSYLYVNLYNLIFFLSFIFLLYSSLYLYLTKDIDYYSNFMYDIDTVKINKTFTIAMFTDAYFPFVGGVPVSIKILTEALIKKGLKVYVFAPEYEKKLKDSYNDPDYIIRVPSITHYKAHGKSSPIANIFSKDIIKKVKELKIDIIHTHHPFWLGFKGNILAKRLRLPSVYTYHTRYEKYTHNLPGFLREILGRRLTHWFIKYFCQRNDVILCPTQDTKIYLRNIGVSKEIFVVPTGLKLDLYKIYDNETILETKYKLKINNKFILLCSSRLDKEKNLYFLIDSFSLVKKEIKQNIVLLIIGDGPEKGNLIKYAEENKVRDDIKFLGLIPPERMPLFYKLSDLFLFPSKTETQGLVVIEAMAGKTPVIAIKSSGVNNIIDNGFNGYLTQENAEIWKNLIIDLYKNHKLRDKMSKNAFKSALNFTDDKMAEKIISIYERLYKRKIIVESLFKNNSSSEKYSNKVLDKFFNKR